jgi:hypothetical protein
LKNDLSELFNFRDDLFNGERNGLILSVHILEKFGETHVLELVIVGRRLSNAVSH